MSTLSDSLASFVETPLVALGAGIEAALIRRLQAAYDARAASLPAFELALDGGAVHRFGRGVPAFRIVTKDRAGTAALASLDEVRICEAFMSGAVDIEGALLPVFGLRDLLSDRHPVLALWNKVVHAAVFGQVESDKKWIAEHYDEDPDFYLLFLGEYRCYSHGIFESPDEPLDVGIRRKLDFALSSVGARPGQKVLDIGAGWGAMTEHGGRRGLSMTSLTISRQSERFVGGLIRDRSLPCKVIYEHLLEYRPDHRFDAIVNLGVTEHLPDYRASLAQYERLLAPGGRIYLDACSARTKFPFSAFMFQYIFPGNPSPMCLHDYLAEVAKTRFEVVAVHNDRENYAITCRHWAERLERAEPEIVRRWGRSWFRRFQLWLWGCVDVFSRDVYGAYRLVLELRA